MARPRKVGLDYFPHDTDASDDEKIQGLLIEHGPEGYGVYFMLVERAYRNDGAILDLSDEMQLKVLAHKMHVDSSSLQNIIKTCAKLGLFAASEWETHQILTSAGMQSRWDAVNELRKGGRERANQSKNKGSSPKNSRKSTQSKVKKSKEKKSILVDHADSFEEFWSAYPKRAGSNPRKRALESYAKAIRNGAKASEILAGLSAYVKAISDKVGTEFVAQATTWLNQERWKDDYHVPERKLPSIYANRNY
jgi:hypothetical protein